MNGDIKKRLLWAGVVAAVLYTAVVIIGAWVTPGYSHVGDHVSTLYQAGSANGAWIATLFAVYNVLVVAFGVGVFHIAADAGTPRRIAGLLGSIALILTGVAGALDAFFPQDPIGMPVTSTGTLHIVFAGLASLLTVIAIVMIAAWALRRPSLRNLGKYSAVTAAVIVVSGPIAAIATANLWSTMGLIERVPIFGFIQWLVAGSIVLAQPR